MIARLTGKLAYKSPEYLVLDVNGVGYQVFVPLSTFYELPEKGDSVGLHTYMAVREDAIELYGFLTLEERELFKLLLTVSKIGPKLARNILSGISVNELKNALLNSNVLKLNAIPGIGHKMAERLVLELKDKIPSTLVVQEVEELSTDEKVADALSALVNLGYKRNLAEQAIKRAIGEIGAESPLEEIIRASLKYFSG
ncbi:MAG: Holliday junction branch migration protein RuvA [Nitrospira sp.]|nr:Holliday junction branch migration protein RuvA [Nitrospira sp.]